jgi:hypothetical protein
LAKVGGEHTGLIIQNKCSIVKEGRKNDSPRRSRRDTKERTGNWKLVDQERGMGEENGKFVKQEIGRLGKSNEEKRSTTPLRGPGSADEEAQRKEGKDLCQGEQAGYETIEAEGGQHDG